MFKSPKNFVRKHLIRLLSTSVLIWSFLIPTVFASSDSISVTKIRHPWPVFIETEPLSGRDLYESYIYEICELYDNVEPELIIALVENESRFTPEAVNKYGTCFGLMQINPKYQTARMERLGITDLFDPYSNILLGVDFLSELTDTYGDPVPALMFYSMGYDGPALYYSGTVSKYVRFIFARADELKLGGV